jgi:hypothetical protein
MPFDKVAEMMQELLGVMTNEETVRRHTEQVGSWMEAWQTEAIEMEDWPEEDLERPSERCVFSPDGAMISLVHRQWAEVRTIALGEPQVGVNANGEKEIHVGKISYFSRLADVSTFIRLAEVEMRRRRVKDAKEVRAIMDGADWCQLFADKHRPDAGRILDFPHAGEHTNELLEALSNAKIHFPPYMLERCLHILKHRGPRPLLRMAEQLPSHLTDRKGIHEHLEYLRKRETMMQYPQFQRDGWPIGSGMVESANKNVVEARLKGTGMHWERKNVNPMLALRNAVCNGRWREMWKKAIFQYKKLHALQRSALVQLRAQALVAVNLSASVEVPPLSSATSAQVVSEVQAQPVLPPQPVAARADTSRSAPWRKRLPYQKRRSSSSQQFAVCPCGAPLVLPPNAAFKRYCSHRCRQRAYRERQAKSA